ncbi:MAG: sulfoxide reductase heme-binding subunit YedZ [Pseudolabrys sp.]|nr:sulfoxide reductase heme-binding subunit YedZ [Pseudolabrys sp.]
MAEPLKPSWQIWKDRRGRLSWLRIATLAILLAPCAKLIVDWSAVYYSARPLNEVIHRAGFWALVFLGLTLAVTPFRRIFRYGSLIDVRRMIGVAAFFYIAAHLILFIADQSFDLGKAAAEIVKRVYLIIGAIAWLGLFALALTSTDAMVKRLGGMRWRRLHQLIYGIALLALIHYFQQTKADVTVPTFTAGLFGWLLGYRLVAWQLGRSELSPLWLLVLGVSVSALTFICEAVGIGFVFNVSPLRVLETAFDFDAGIRPGWQVLAASLCVVVLETIFARWRRAPAKPVLAQ